MKFSKRKFTKILFFSTLVLLFPVKTLLATTKKIINPNLSKEQIKLLNQLSKALIQEKNYPGTDTFLKAISKIKD